MTSEQMAAYLERRAERAQRRRDRDATIRRDLLAGTSTVKTLAERYLVTPERIRQIQKKTG